MSRARQPAQPASQTPDWLQTDVTHVRDTCLLFFHLFILSLLKSIQTFPLSSGRLE